MSERTRKNVLSILAVVAAVQFIALAVVLSMLDRDEPPPPPEEPVETVVDEMPDYLVPDAAEEPEQEQPEEVPEEPVSEREPPEGSLSAPEILEKADLVAHGMGKLEDVTTLNCLEGFQTHYAAGVRVFEADLRLTADLEVILRHDWRAGWQEGISETAVPTLEEYLSKPLLEKYTPLSFRDLLLLMEEYPDVCIITDSKVVEEEMVTVQFKAMLEDARELGLSYLFDRIVIQVYSKEMHTVVDALGDFPHYIFTLYRTDFDRTEEYFADVARWCSETGVGGVTMWYYWWKSEFAPIADEYGISVYVHTLNDPEQAKQLLAEGVDGIYSDSLAPADLAEPEEPTEE